MRTQFLVAYTFAVVLVAGTARADPPPTAPGAIMIVTASRPVVVSHKPHPKSKDRAEPFSCGAPGSVGAYNGASGVSFDARIVRVTIRPDETVLVLRDRAGKTCAYLPGKAELARHGIDAALLRKRTPVTVDGFANRENRRKVLVQQLTVHPTVRG